MKTEFESRVEYRKVKLRYIPRNGSQPYEATVYWNGQLYETIKISKELCLKDLKRKAGL